MASIKNIKVTDGTSEDENKLEKIVSWKKKCEDVEARLYEAEEDRRRRGKEVSQLRKELRILHGKTLDAITNENALFDDESFEDDEY